MRRLGGDTEYPLAGLPILLVLAITNFEPQKTQERKSFIIPRVVTASDDVGLSPVSFMIIPNTKRIKTDQLPISEVITGLPRPYHNASPP